MLFPFFFVAAVREGRERSRNEKKEVKEGAMNPEVQRVRDRVGALPKGVEHGLPPLN